MFVWLIAACVPRLECGPDTVEANGFCVASIEPTVCGPGTIERDGACLPDPGQLCGPGTVEVDGECVVENPIQCGPGTVLRGGVCIEAEIQDVSLPFPAGDPVSLSQGHHGFFSHNGSSTYAIDIPVPEGTPFTAARGGKVWNVYDESNTGCGEPSCADQGNFVIVDHGDGTFGRYWHLEFEGALVAPGDDVARGQVLGFTGNTGWSTGPHLHFEVTDMYYQSLPLFVDEYAELSNGVPFVGPTVVSANQEQPVGSPTYSDCPADLFQHLGVTLDAGVPCSVATPGQAYPVSGVSGADSGLVIINQFDRQENAWVATCTPTDANGRFSTTLTWPDNRGFGYLLISAAGGDCFTYTGWNSSPTVQLRAR